MVLTHGSSNPYGPDFGAKWYTDVLYRGLNQGSIVFVRPMQGPKRKYFTRAAVFDLSQPGGLDAATKYARDHGQDCYHKYNLFDGVAVTSRTAAIGGKNEVSHIVAFGLDLDVDWKDNKYLTQQQLIDVCNAMPLAPSVIVGSDGVNGGLHVYWAVQVVDVNGFPGGYDNLNSIACRWYRELARRIAALGGVIDATAGLERLLRFPGMLRSKSGQRVTVIGGTGQRYTLHDLILEPDDYDKEQLRLGSSNTNSDSMIARGLDALGYEIQDIIRWLGWSERTDGSGEVDRPEATSASCTGIYASSRDGRLGITIRTPGAIKTLATDPISGAPLETKFSKITWLSREALYVMATEGSVSQDAWKRAASKFSGLPNEDNFQPVDSDSRAEFFSLSAGTKLPLANFTVVRTGDKTTTKNLSVDSIMESLRQRCGVYPKSLNGGSLIIPDATHGAKIMKKPSQLFAALHAFCQVSWKGGGVTKEELYEYLVASQQRVEDVEVSPHFPPVPDVEYTHDGIVPGDGSELEKWLSLWQPESHVDRELILGLLATVFWGGTPGQRPFFLITTTGETKVGSGKSTLAEQVAEAANRGSEGHYLYRSSGTPDRFFGQLLTPTHESKRVVLLDNLKSYVVGGQDIESLITSRSINGHRLFCGDGTRSNRLTWIGTGNSVKLSDDLASRTFVIVLKPAKYDKDFQSRLRAIDFDRLAGDLASFFQRPRQLFNKCSRFAEWDNDIRSRLDSPDLIYETNLQRVMAHNDDVDIATEVREKLIECISACYTVPDARKPDTRNRPVDSVPDAKGGTKDVPWTPDKVQRNVKLFLPNAWLVMQLATFPLVRGKNGQVSGRSIGRLFEQIAGKIPELSRPNSNKNGRGWIWSGANTQKQAIDTQFSCT
ncbi:MAG TPA: hypothetical protein DDW52_20245 [Planctomycetaceae bacterium]|nr:hypothetical protein [Planctomycetaceae bacterium]